MKKVKRKNEHEKAFEKNANEKKGITLISLVVTMVVIIIIASITTAALLRR